MKNFKKNILLFLFFGTAIMMKPENVSAQAEVSFQVFYDGLSPYGSWINNPDYGYVWVPNVAAGFTPYSTNGHWVFTDEGWTWVSDYPWGWAPFHYGRWYTDAHYGPMWVPGNEWGPGWVTWRRSSGYYGWAPIGPGVSISVAYGNGYNVPYNQWRFVREHDFGRRDINNYYVNSGNNVTIIKNSTVINNTYVNKSRNVTYNSGPDRNEVEKVGGKKITPVSIRESSKPGQNMNKDGLELYRPHVQNNNSGDKKPAPAKVSNMKDAKTPAQKDDQSSPQKANQQEKQNAPQPQKDNTSKKPEGAKQPQNTEGEKQPPQTTQPVKQQPSQQQHKEGQQGKKEHTQPQHNVQPHQQQSSPSQQHANPPKK